MFPTRINLLPFWMPQMDVDIRKPVTHRFGIERPGQSTNYSTSDDIDDDSDDDSVTEENSEERTDSQGSPTLRGDDSPDSDSGFRRLREARDAMEQYDLDRTGDPSNSLDIEERIAAAPLENPDDYPIYDSDDEDVDDIEEAKRIGGWYYRRKVFTRHVAMVGSYLVANIKKVAPVPQPTPIPGPSLPQAIGPVEGRKFKAPKGKRIHVPVRVEPKVYFAAERTFLSWLEFSIILGSIAATLLNFGDALSLASAWTFTILACLALLYSMVLYLWRVRMIRGRRAVRYHDRWGPTLLCVGLLIAVAVSFGVRIGSGSDDTELRG